MLGRMRTALKFLTYGIVVGVLFAPRSGAESRHELTSWLRSTASGLFGSGGGDAARA